MRLAEVLLVYRPTILLLGILLSNWLIFYGLYSEATFLRSLTQKQVDVGKWADDAEAYVWAHLAVNLATLLIVVGLVVRMRPAKGVDPSQSTFVFDEKLRYVIVALITSACLWFSIDWLSRQAQNDSEADTTTRRLFDAQSRMRLLYVGFSLAYIAPLGWYARSRVSSNAYVSVKYHVEDLDRRLSTLEVNLDRRVTHLETLSLKQLSMLEHVLEAKLNVLEAKLS